MMRKGPLAWMVDHGVAPNLLMVLFIVGGLMASLAIKKEVFPEFETEIVQVTISYPGATPEDVEQSLLLPVEAAIADVEGIDELTASASEGSGVVSATLIDGIDVMRAYQDIQQSVNAITTLPAAADPPRFTLAGRSRSVVSLQVYGSVGLAALHDAAESVRAELQATSGISRAELSGNREREIQVHLDEEAIKRYGLDHQQLASRIAEEALDLASGQLTTAEGEWLIRYQGRRNSADEFAELPILTTAQGAPVVLGDIARVSEGFAETDREEFYNGLPGLSVDVYQIGDQTPTSISNAVYGELERLRTNLPDGVRLDVSRDSSEVYEDRLSLLLKNAWMGLALVLFLMALFLEARLAFWVTLGIPTAFLGAMLFLPWVGVSLNMMSMFAFIIALGIVVDDAIMVGENIYSYREQGYSLRDAAVKGAQEIATPLTFAILSNIVAFLPLLFLPGFLGLIFATVPVVVITVFIISLVEALFILPAHLAHASKPRQTPAWQRPIEAVRLRMQRGLHHVTYRQFEPLLQRALDQRLLTVSVGVAILCVTLAWAMSGRLGFSLMPRVESDQVQASVTLPIGSHISVSRELSQQLLDAAEQLSEREEALSFRSTRSRLDGESLEVRLDIAPESLDAWPPSRIAREWRELTGDLLGAQSVRFESDVGGPGSGAALSLRLSHPDTHVLEAAASRLAERLGEYGLTDIDSGLGDGKPQLEMRLSAEGRSLGLTGSDLAQALRGPLQGATAVEQFIGRQEVSVEVRLPETSRNSLSELYRLPIRTPDGMSVPLSRVADITLSQASSSLQRIDGRRIITVTADSEGDQAINQVIATLQEEVFPTLSNTWPGLEVSMGGRQQDTADNLATLRTAMWLMLAALYALLAIPFRSYLQPLLVMAAIPFGIVGAVGGHLLMGFGLSIISLLGMLALSGVVINDALVLIDYANRKRREGLAPREAIVAAATRRLRPIMMTTLTTFLGLAPMILETSRQARFMIPMAISLGFGMLFATLILLLVVPCLYLSLENLRERLSAPHPPSQTDMT
ncbi:MULTISPECIES: efflux RND transporter permease subunit [unclassified Halomonas]|uniref:efflux RND transporter permease subunit n=1 Tax=unclassified Halomonas TaxID=2609666 RepID=UPI001EF5D1F1|nr:MULTISPECIES: efflux RND transporter permease subunit [unclassified Halomonas]MCG7576079.1 efflux RND transporter permease subunit [Halomonas sp. MMH1-48]MCG7603142.1 efflux RND transporter permease subunit [Halomonas sp. MM17-34]MCG7612392.1 efflux RND transporter permease subunit [Halomonas sp. MM17-29]MCG7619273.1 efflux RND transporter permease subunit [Halomonas sp. DSH1-27]